MSPSRFADRSPPVPAIRDPIVIPGEEDRTAVSDDTVPAGGLVVLVWKCKCHGWLYSDPRHCKHTAASNLIPPE
jgi:hypothetical protein